MIRVGPSRNAQAGGIAAILSCLGIVLCFIGFFLIIPGIALIASSNNSAFDDPFFDDVNEGQRVAGIVCLTLGLIMMVAGIICCIFMCKKANEAVRNQSGQTQGVVIAGGPVVTGSVPMGQQYNTSYNTGGYAPAPAPYGQPQQPPAYPPVGQVQAGGQYPPVGGQYAPAQYPPPPTNPAYPQQNYGYGSNDAAPPPSYGDAVKQ